MRKKYVYATTLLLVLLSAQNIFACQEINLFQSNPKVLENEIVNQGDSGTCYAHTLSSLYNMEKATSKTDALHPYWIAFIHKNRYVHWKPKSLDYSLMGWAYSDLRKNGICSYELISKKIERLKNGVPYSNDQLMYMLHNFFKIKRGFLGHKRSYQQTLEKMWKELTKVPTEFEIAWNTKDLDTILAPLQFLSHKSFFAFLKSQVFEDCRDNRAPANDELVAFGRSFESNQKTSQTIEAVLNLEQAVAIGYCSKKVYEADPFTTKDSGTFPRIARAVDDKCGAHYSLLVGSRRVGNSCEYLLRNSYGTGFWGYAGMECWCLDKSNNQQRNCKKEENNPNLKVLGCWVNSMKMTANSYDQYYLK